MNFVRQAEAKAKAAHKIIDIVIYPDAPHGFHHTVQAELSAGRRGGSRGSAC